MPKVLLPLAQGFEEIELVSIADVLRRSGIEVVLASLSQSLEVKGAHTITLKADTLLENIQTDSFDAIALHGGMEGVHHMLNSPLLLEMLKVFNQDKKIISAICAAPIVLDEIGILQKDFSCYPGCEKMMRNTQSQRLHKPFVREGNILTGMGPAFAMVFAVELVSILLGEESAQNLREDLLLNSF